MPGRILALYALACMDREGPVYGYSIARRVAEATEGHWRPGAGTIYPALASLVRRDLAAATVKGRRRWYRITPDGRALLRRIRAGRAERTSAPDLTVLWATVVGGPTDPLTAHLDRADRAVRTLTAYLARSPRGQDARRAAGRARSMLAAADRRLTRLERAAGSGE